MIDNNLKKDTSFIILATLLLILFTISTYTLSYQSIEGILIPGICFGFAFVILSWILTHQSHLRKTWPYLTIFILTFIYVNFWKIIYFSLDFSYKKLKFIDYNIFEIIIYLQIIIRFLAVLTVVIIFWYLVKPKDFQDKKQYFFIKKENTKKTILTIIIPFLVTTPYWLNLLTYYLNKNFHADLLLSSMDLYHWYIFLIKAIPLFFAAIFFAIIINHLKDNKKYYLYTSIGIFVLIQNISILSIFNLTAQNFLTNIIFFSLKNGISFFFIFLSLLLLTKKRYLD